MRDLFAQVAANGRVSIKQINNRLRLDGWAKTNVNGFELLGIRGIAKQQGVIIADGVFDNSNDIRLHPDGLIEMKMKIVFTNLSVTENENGPLQSTFKLPVPINAAVNTVTAPDNSITMNLQVSDRADNLRDYDLFGPAVDAVGQVLLRGVVNIGAKIVVGAGSLVGIKGEEAKPEVPVVVWFLPGYAELDRSDQVSIGKTAHRLAKEEDLEVQLRHTLTAGDVARAQLRANPSPEDCLALAEKLRKEKAELLARRAVLSAQACGEIGSQSDQQAAASLALLKQTDRQLASAEDSLDQLYDMLRPGAARQSDRRTRAASIDIGRQRIDQVQAALLRYGGSQIDAKIQKTNPQFDPNDSSDGGEVVMTLVPKKH